MDDVETCCDTPPSPPCNEPLVHVGVTRSGLVGRPRLQVLREHLQTLHNDAGFCWADIVRILGIWDRTLRRRRHEFGLSVGMGEHFSDITDDELDVNVRQILQAIPNAGNARWKEGWGTGACASNVIVFKRLSEERTQWWALKEQRSRLFAGFIVSHAPMLYGKIIILNRWFYERPRLGIYLISFCF